MSQIRQMLKNVLKRSFFRLLPARAPVNKEPLTLFAQVLYKSLNQWFSIYQCLGFGRCSQMCWKGAFSGFCLLWRLWTKSLWLSLLKFCPSLWIKFSLRCGEKGLFPAFCLLERLWTRRLWRLLLKSCGDLSSFSSLYQNCKKIRIINNKINKKNLNSH